MTREDHIEILKQYKEKPTLINEISSVEEAVWLDEALDAAIQALEQTRWIPVERELPDIHNYCMKYLVTDCYGHIHTSLFTESRGKSWWSYSDVIAWMPLPEPYKAESEVSDADSD